MRSVRSSVTPVPKRAGKGKPRKPNYSPLAKSKWISRPVDFASAPIRRSGRPVKFNPNKHGPRNGGFETQYTQEPTSPEPTPGLDSTAATLQPDPTPEPTPESIARSLEEAETQPGAPAPKTPHTMYVEEAISPKCAESAPRPATPHTITIEDTAGDCFKSHEWRPLNTTPSVFNTLKDELDELETPPVATSSASTSFTTNAAETGNYSAQARVRARHPSAQATQKDHFILVHKRG